VTLIAADVRRIVRFLWVGFLAVTGCLWWAKRCLRANGAVIPLMFHRVLGDVDYERTHSLPGMIIRERTLRHLVTHVVRRYEAVDLREAEPGKPSSKLQVAFTFDDGWIDTYDVAFPIVREHCIPITVFLCPGLIDKEIPFWQERVVALLRATRPSAGTVEMELLIERLKRTTPEGREKYLVELREEVQKQTRAVEPSGVDSTLSWNAIAEMGEGGVRFGSHTQTHQILTMVRPDAARQEVHESKNAIESALSRACDAFAYPNGDYSPETREILAEAGFRLAVTTECGAWTTNCDSLAIPRLNVCEDNVVGPTGRFSSAMFEYTTFWKAWRAAKANSDLAARAHPHTARITV
jgi:peptidoglycan/xylan/chitin deacetylase (PgdA/CDA1 family)